LTAPIRKGEWIAHQGRVPLGSTSKEDRMPTKKPGRTRTVAGRPQITDTHLMVGGRRVRVLRAAGRHRGEGEPQLLVHGLGASSVTWVEVMEGLAEHGPVVAVDLPGFGHTAAVDDDTFTVPAYVSFVLEVADALGWEQFSLHGNSMGGLIAALVASRRPERVRRLVLVSPALPARSPARMLVPTRATVGGFLPIVVSSTTAAALALVGLAGPQLSERRNRDLLRLIFPDPDSVDPGLLRLMAADLAADDGPDGAQRRRSLLTALGSIAAIWTDPRGAWRAIDRIVAPTLVVGGTKDALVPARTLRAVLARRPDWVGHVLDDRRHALMLEDPELYLELVAEFRSGAERAA
jgi:pimeloyl-ACP methyl ester carboxylesterase